jgi:hypothetical protein
MTVLHVPWIDRFPFPQMRDNAIRMSCRDNFDEEEFLFDVFMGETFTITPGSLSWDPSAWAVTKSFEEKWRFLLC